MRTILLKFFKIKNFFYDIFSVVEKAYFFLNLRQVKMPRKRRLLSGQVRRRHRARRWCFALSDRVKGLVLLYGRRRSSQAQMSGNGRRGGRRIVAGQAANARDPTGQGQIRLRFREAAAYAHRSCSARRLLLAFGGVFF